jgi:hypothetical protein
MDFESFREKRENLKVMIHFLECFRDEIYSKNWTFRRYGSFRYWLDTLRETQKENESDEQWELDIVASELERDFDALMEKAAQLAESKHNIKLIRKRADQLISDALRQYRGMLAVNDAIFLDEPAELEDKISDSVDKYFFKSKFFKFQIVFIGAVVALSGFGTMKLFSGADRAGEIVYQMNQRVLEAREQINKQLAEALSEEKKNDMEKKVVDGIKAKVEKKIKKNVDDEINKVLTTESINNAADKGVNEIIKNANITKENIEAKVQGYIGNNVDNAFKPASFADGVRSYTRGKIDDAIDPKQGGMNVTKFIKDTVSNLKINKQVKSQLPTQLKAVLNDRVSTIIDPKKFPNEVNNLIKTNVNDRITSEIGEQQLSKQVDDVIDARITDVAKGKIAELQVQPLLDELESKRHRMSQLEHDITTLEQRVQVADRNTQFTFFTIWDNSDKFLKASVILLYTLLIIVIIVVAVLIIIFLKNLLSMLIEFVRRRGQKQTD